MEDFSVSTIQQLQDYCASHPGGVFSKTLDKSAKNDIDLKPLRTPLEILQQLASSRDILLRLEKSSGDTHLVLLPWNDQISKRNEYRIFVCDGKVVAVSQQQWSNAEARITLEEATIAAASAERLVNDKLRGCVHGQTWQSMPMLTMTRNYVI